MKYLDLHTHSHYSDGTCSPAQIVIDSTMLGTNILAITDHDTTEGYYDAREEAKKWGVEILPGVEISAERFHILGYDFDMGNKNLQGLLQYVRGSQEKIVQERVKKFNEIGIPLTFEKVRQYSFPNARLGKLNLITALMRDKECMACLGNLSSGEMFDKYLKKGMVAAEIDYPDEISPKEAVDTIHKAGGVAVLAHPFKQLDDASQLEDFVRVGIDGIEVQPNYGDENNQFRVFAEENGLLITYGSDFHGARFTHRPLLSRNGNAVKDNWRVK